MVGLTTTTVFRGRDVNDGETASSEGEVFYKLGLATTSAARGSW